MVQKTYRSRASKKPFYVPASAFLLAFLLAFSPLQIFAQEKVEIAPSVSSTVLDTDSRINDDTKPISDTDKPADDKPDDPVITDPRPDTGTDDPKPVDPVDPKPSSESEEDSQGEQVEEDQVEENRDVGVSNSVVQTQVVPENIKREKAVNLKDGSLSYEYGLALPPGRNNLTPEVSLTYNSNNRKVNSMVGIGWSLDIPYIERTNKTGSEKLYTDDYFSSSMTGDLVLSSGSSYVSKIDNGEFLLYTYENGYWIVYDKEGTKYTFGENASARQDDPNDSGRVFKWMIEEIRDTNDNYIRFEYYKDEGQIYPLVITYTGNGITDGIFEIIFERENIPYPLAQNDTGFKVTTNERISEIRAEVDGDWVRKYELTYTAGDNMEETLLDTITESGIDDDSNVVSRDPIDFDYTDATPGWTYDADWYPPMSFVDSTDFGMRMADINGDGLMDVVCYRDDVNGLCNDNNPPTIYLNDGDGFSTGSGWSAQPFVDDEAQDLGVRLIDVNGDGLNDLIRAYGTVYNEIYINNGSNWVLDTSWTMPLTFEADDYGLRMADINGDGLVDILCHHEDTDGACDKSNPQILLNTGSGWTSPTPYQFPTKVDDANESEAFLDSNMNDRGLRIVDINGDGLADLIRGKETDMYVYINTGSGWEYDADWEQPLPFFENGDTGMRLEDINADGLVDIICQREVYNVLCNNNNATPTYLNNGYGWSQVTWGLPGQYDNPNEGESFIGSNNDDKGLRLADINGDGVSDLMRGQSGNNFTYLSNSTTKSDLMSKITYPEGGSTEISYKGTPQFLDDSGDLLNPNLPMVNIVVSETQDDDNNGNVSTHQYEYADGEYYFTDYLDRKFAGFGLVTETDALGNVTKTYFQQGNDTNDTLGEYDDNPSKIGKAYRIEKYDDSENLYDLTIHQYKNIQPVSGADFVFPMSSVNLSYDGDGDHKDTAVGYMYDESNGNLLEKTSYGEVSADTNGEFSDTGSDLKTEQYTYAVDPYYRIRSKVSEYQTLDQSSSVVNKKITYYDDQSQGTVVIGNPTQEDQLISGSDYSTTEFDYDGVYGLVKRAYDPLNNLTSYVYDSHNLYPETITNALSQETDYIYDYSSGKPVNITDPNGTQKEYVYDGFDRVLEEKESAPDNVATLLLKNEYTYDDTSGEISVQKTMHLNGSLSHDEYQYFDGLGRLIQTRSEAEGSNTYNVKDTEYDALGHVAIETLPYEDSGSAISSPTTDAELQIIHEYDPLGRIHQTTNIIGNTRYEYDQWMTTITNQNDIPKDLYKDAFNRLVQVDEHNATSTYSTLYEWDLNDKLVGLEDALGNVRTFSYDNLGHRLTATDLHATGDGTYGTWYYEYDEAGNMINLVDPNGDIITYEYDELNRIETEDSDTTGENPDVEYIYDTCTNGVGKLCTVENSQGVTTDYHYFDNGMLQEEARDIHEKDYSTIFSYDRQGNILTIEYVDKGITQYSYNKGNQVETIIEDEDGVPPVDIVLDVDYSPYGAPAYIEYGNGVETTNTYDDEAMYRLENILTTGGTDNFQDITFEAYDNMGNITSIKDQSDTDAAKTLAYTYDDLNRLISVDATGTANSADYSRDYTYNAIGNLTSSDWGLYAYNGNTGVLYANPHAATHVSSVSLTYDKNGNALTDVSSANTWNYRNELSQLVHGGVDTYTYTYDHNSDRMSVDNGSSTSYYPNKYYNEIEGVVSKNIYLNDTLVGTVERSGSGAKYHYNHSDHLTGSNVTTDDTGALEQTLDYFPFGESRINDQVTSFDQNRKYANSVADDSGLNFMNARYQNGSVGRFISQDPVFRDLGTDLSKYGTDTEKLLSNPQILNSYSYATNNPIKYNDPDGEIIDTIADLGFIAYDLYKIGQALARGESAGEYTKSLGLDVGGALLPGVTGLGVAGRLVNKADNVADAAKSLPDDALVVRGGGLANQTPENINKAINKSISEGGRGFSVQCSAGCTNINQLGELSRHLPNKEVSVTTVGQVRALGGDLIKTPGSGNHYSVINLDGFKASSIINKVYKNLNRFKK